MKYQGKWYAETFSSERYVGVEKLSLEAFETEEDMYDFIESYNAEHLHFIDGPTPDKYKMAQSATMYTILDFKFRGKL